MKLKLVVVSMSVLGLISSSAFAANHHSKHHHVANKQEVVAPDYKDMGSFPPAPVETCATNSSVNNVLDMLSQNVGRAKPTEDCNKLIALAGGINFDAHWGNRSMGYMGENTQRLSLNDAYLNVFGNVNEWTKAFASISYGNPSGENLNSTKASLYDADATASGQYSSVYSVNTLNLEQGFIRFANFDQYPVFIQLGKQFQPFGQYTIHPIVRSFSQVLTETLATSAEVGFVLPVGVHGAIFAFDNPLAQRSSATATTAQGHTKPNYGAEIGFVQSNDQLGYNVGLGYLYNFTGVNDVNYAVSAFTSSGPVADDSFYSRVAAATIYGNLNSGPFTLGAHYVSALSRFNSNDLQNKTILVGGGNGAKPWAGDIQAGYGFNAWNKAQNVYVGYQASGDAINIFLPKTRWLAGYNVDMWKNTSLGAEIGHNIDYSKSTGGTGNGSNTIALRAAVKFG